MSQPTPWTLVSLTMATVGIACGITRMARIRHDRWRRWVSVNWGNNGNGYDNADWRRDVDMYHEFDIGNRRYLDSGVNPAPKQKTFSYIRLATTQYQTIFVPALGAMVSGLFVSLAASFFYLGLTGKPAEPWPQWVGAIMFISGAIALHSGLHL